MQSELIEPLRPLAVVVGSRFVSLCGRLGIPVVESPMQDAFVLHEAAGALELRPPGEGERTGIRAHFPPDRKGPGGQRTHPLVRAFGSPSISVLDVTAGLGSDAYRLAAAGHRVRACERDPVVFALLTTGWEESCRSGRVPAEVVARLEFVHGEAAELIASIEGEGVGVYLDPMYPPPRRASALPRREIQILRRLIGESQGAASLLAEARKRAGRVVVKRPHHAPALATGASFSLESKLVRFDVYLDPSRMGTRTA